MRKASFQQRWHINWLLVVILLVVLVIGFAGGFFYERSRKNTPVAAPLSPAHPVSPICNCPNIPVGESTQQYCSC